MGLFTDDRCRQPSVVKVCSSIMLPMFPAWLLWNLQYEALTLEIFPLPPSFGKLWNSFSWLCRTSLQLVGTPASTKTLVIAVVCFRIISVNHHLLDNNHGIQRFALVSHYAMDLLANTMLWLLHHSCSLSIAKHQPFLHQFRSGRWWWTMEDWGWQSGWGPPACGKDYFQKVRENDDGLCFKQL